jgi:inner membrane protein
MFIAHAPSGYLLSVATLKRLQVAPASTKAIFIAAVAGAVVPDFDLLYFFLIDQQQTHHHKYFPHLPWVWFSLLGVSIVARRVWSYSPIPVLSLVFCLGGILHVILDTLVGDIWWLAPLVDRPYALFTVPARFDPWWLNFILHWSFLAELAICAWALAIYRRRSN